MFGKIEVCTIKLANVRWNLIIVLFFKKTVNLNNPTPPTVFAAHPSNFAQTLTTKLQRASWSRIFEYVSQIFLRTTESQNFIEKLPFKNFEYF